MNRLKPHQIDAGGLADGSYALSVTDGKVTALAPVGSGGGAGGIATQRLHLRRSGGSQTIPANTWTNITWGVERADAWSGFDAGTSPTNITVDESGMYGVFLKAALGGATASVGMALYCPATDEYVLHVALPGSSGPQLAGTAFLDATKSYVARINSASSNSLLDGDFGYRTDLVIAKIKGA